MEEKILLLRDTFNQLTPDLQFKEARRLMRLVKKKRPIKVSPIYDPDLEVTFDNVEEVVNYLFNLGYSRISSSNIYKCLKGERKSVCKHKVFYGED